MAKKMLVDLERCIGCWTCAMACKVCHDLPDDEYRITIETKGSGAGIDRPAGVYPDLHMSWQPLYHKTCTWCAERQAKGEPLMCVYDCPTEALAYGDEDDPESAFSVNLARCEAKGCHTFELPESEGMKHGVVYAAK